ncbi:unnamed protein product [Phytophthora lilii]|uniref:Unnamed protein product n=1 Tax=Phytophthora lilii TaxID=2077276 RepID=A0A9W6TK56_9STRA|nr:unnamed protein product [Phytophthora lilii]
MHKEVATLKEKKRLYEMARAKGSVGNFEVGDFVLWSRVDSRLQGNKLLVRWVGPFRVVEARQHAFVVEHLITKGKIEVHGSRLKFYSDASLEVTAELKEHVASQGIVVGVRAIVGHRKHPVTNEWEVKVAWLASRTLRTRGSPSGRSTPMFLPRCKSMSTIMRLPSSTGFKARPPPMTNPLFAVRMMTQR